MRIDDRVAERSVLPDEQPFDCRQAPHVGNDRLHLGGPRLQTREIERQLRRASLAHSFDQVPEGSPNRPLTRGLAIRNSRNAFPTSGLSVRNPRQTD